jgi:hypothetical protein
MNDWQVNLKPDIVQQDKMNDWQINLKPDIVQ